MDNNLKQRNRALLWILVGLCLLLYIVSFIKTQGNV